MSGEVNGATPAAGGHQVIRGCARCDHDGHTCPGCGASIHHGEEACAECSAGHDPACPGHIVGAGYSYGGLAKNCWRCRNVAVGPMSAVSTACSSGFCHRCGGRAGGGAPCDCPHHELTPSPPLGCADCGLLYGDPSWCDVVIPDEDWLEISPTGHEGGVLCFTCIARRLVAVGRRNVPMLVTSGPFEHHPAPRDAASEGES